MSLNITTAFVAQTKDNIALLSQQKGSRLESAVRYENQDAEYDYYDQIGASDAERIDNRHGDSPTMNTAHYRRRVGLTGYDWGDFVDKEDKVRVLNDPTSSYAITAARAMARAKDDVIIAAMGGTAYTGQAGGTAVTFPAAQKVAVASTGMTIAKLLSAKEILDGNEVDEEIPRHIVMSSDQFTDLLNTTEVKSSDYNTVKALVKGEIDTFLGFKFHRSERLETDDSSSRLCYAWAEDGVLLAVGIEPECYITQRADKRFSWYVYYKGMFGSTRMEEEKVVQIACSES